MTTARKQLISLAAPLITTAFLAAFVVLFYAVKIKINMPMYYFQVDLKGI